MCIVFLASQGDRVLVGNNEDYVYPKNRVWYVPSAGGNIEGSVFEFGRYPRVYYGYDGIPPQSGMNEAGLCFAITSAAPQEIAGAAERAEYDGYLVDKVMAECTTVEDALDFIAPYVIRDLERACLFFGDKTGDSAIVEGNAILRKEGRRQVLSNFRQSQVAPDSHACDRYRIAVEMLDECSDISVEHFRRILVFWDVARDKDLESVAKMKSNRHGSRRNSGVHVRRHSGADEADARRLSEPRARGQADRRQVSRRTREKVDMVDPNDRSDRVRVPGVLSVYARVRELARHRRRHPGRALSGRAGPARLR